jgi:hypothetical protein
MALTKDEAAKELADGHFGVEPYLERVIRILADNEDEPGEPIKLLEVNGATVATGSVEVFAFAPSKSIPFAITIAEVTPEEFERIGRKELPLPRGWSLENCKQFPRPRAA